MRTDHREGMPGSSRAVSLASTSLKPIPTTA